jgi:hypothetical protein
MNWRDPKHREGWLDWRRKRFWAWVLLLTYTLVGFVIAPWILRGVIVNTIQDQLALTAHLDDVDLNPFALSLRLRGLGIDEQSGAPLVKLDDLYVNFELSSLVHRAWTFSEFDVTNPYVRVERAKGRLNLLALAGPPSPNDPPEPTSDATIPLLVEHFQLLGGQADVIDKDLRDPLETKLGPISVTINGFTTMPDVVGEQEVAFVTERGGHVTWSGDLGFGPFHSAGHASVTGIPLAKLSGYVPPEFAIAIGSGTSDISFDYSIARETEGFTAAVRGFTLALRDMHVVSTLAAPDGMPPPEVLSFDMLRFAGGELSWPQRSVAFKEISLTSPTIAFARDAAGKFSWEQLIATTPPPTAPGETQTPAAETQPWRVGIEMLKVEGGVVHFADQGNAPAANLGLTGINLSLQSLSLEDGAAFPLHLDFAVDGGGTIALDGSLTAVPELRLSAAMQVSGLVLPIVQPYVASATNVEVGAGTLDLKGQLASSPEESLAFDGTIDVQGLEVLGEATRTRLVGWKRLALDGLALRLDAARAEVASLTLDEPYGRVHIAKDGTLNLATVLRPDEPAQGQETEAPEPEASPTPEKPWSMKFGRVRLVNGATDYRDENLPLPFAIAVHTLNGEMGAFDTNSRAPAKLELQGQVGEFGEARINGTLQPLDVTRNSTIEAFFRNISMPDASPYSIRFAGHTIASGKLDLKMTYKLADGRLNGQHDIVLRDFELGEKVDYPGAMDLPYGLAISLLKGPDGNIDVELPIEGDLNDPTFRIGGVIVKALVNLLTKIITSPFRLLGSLVGLGESEQLDQVAFAPGRADLAPPEREKIAKLAEALTQRPQLTLQIPGVVERAADGAALREAQVNARVEAAVAGGDQKARRKVLEKRFEDAMPNEPLKGLVQQFTTPAADSQPASFDELAYLGELQQRLIGNEPLAPDALDALGAERSAAVRDGVLATPTVTAERVTTLAIEDVTLNDDGAVAMTLKVDVHGS